MELDSTAILNLSIPILSGDRPENTGKITHLRPCYKGWWNRKFFKEFYENWLWRSISWYKSI